MGPVRALAAILMILAAACSRRERPAKQSDLDWPSQRNWIHGGLTLPSSEPPRLPDRLLTIRWSATPALEAAEEVAHGAGLELVVTPGADSHLRRQTVGLEADEIPASDALELLLMQVAPEGAVVWELEEDSLILCEP